MKNGQAKVSGSTQGKPRQCLKSAPAREVGFSTLVLDQLITAGPAGLRGAQRTALRYAKRYLEGAADSWKLETEWLKSFDAVIRVYDAAGTVIERYEHKGEFKDW
jgi:hypothetical protein